jgi:orotate phosphoribosyltransferase
LPVLKECGAEAIAGPTLGADPIVSSVAVMSHVEGSPIAGLIVRKEAKGHGGKRAIEGPLRAGMRVAVVDDACTTGGNLLHAIEAVESEGCQVVKVIAILDRREGGSDEIKRRGYDFIALLEANESGEITAVGE